jgi:hypothetical protein
MNGKEVAHCLQKLLVRRNSTVFAVREREFTPAFPHNDLFGCGRKSDAAKEVEQIAKPPAIVLCRVASVPVQKRRAQMPMFDQNLVQFTDEIAL